MCIRDRCQSLLAAGLPQSGAVRLTARGTRTAVDGTLAPQLLGRPAASRLWHCAWVRFSARGSSPEMCIRDSRPALQL